MDLFGNKNVKVTHIPQDIMDAGGFMDIQKNLPDGVVMMSRADSHGNVISSEPVDLLAGVRDMPRQFSSSEKRREYNMNQLRQNTTAAYQTGSSTRLYTGVTSTAEPNGCWHYLVLFIAAFVIIARSVIAG